MLQVGDEFYTENELLTIIKKYEEIYGPYITKRHYDKLPREIKEHIIQHLPYYPTIVNKSYQNVNTYSNLYCKLPLNKESIIKFIKSQTDYIMYMFIIDGNQFIMYGFAIYSHKISKIETTTIKKTQNRFTFEFDVFDWYIFVRPSFDILDVMDQYDNIIFDIDTTYHILKSYQCYKYINILNMMRQQIDYYFGDRKPSYEHINQSFYNMKSNIFIWINTKRNKKYINTIAKYPLAAAKFDSNGFFVEWKNYNDVDEYNYNWFVDDEDPTLIFDQLIDVIVED